MAAKHAMARLDRPIALEVSVSRGAQRPPAPSRPPQCDTRRAACRGRPGRKSGQLLGHAAGRFVRGHAIIPRCGASLPLPSSRSWWLAPGTLCPARRGMAAVTRTRGVIPSARLTGTAVRSSSRWSFRATRRVSCPTRDGSSSCRPSRFNPSPPLPARSCTFPRPVASSRAVAPSGTPRKGTSTSTSSHAPCVPLARIPCARTESS